VTGVGCVPSRGRTDEDSALSEILARLQIQAIYRGSTGNRVFPFSASASARKGAASATPRANATRFFESHRKGTVELVSVVKYNGKNNLPGATEDRRPAPSGAGGIAQTSHGGGTRTNPRLGFQPSSILRAKASANENFPVIPYRARSRKTSLDRKCRRERLGDEPAARPDRRLSPGARPHRPQHVPAVVWHEARERDEQQMTARRHGAVTRHLERATTTKVTPAGRSIEWMLDLQPLKMRSGLAGDGLPNTGAAASRRASVEVRCFHATMKQKQEPDGCMPPNNSISFRACAEAPFKRAGQHGAAASTAEGRAAQPAAPVRIRHESRRPRLAGDSKLAGRTAAPGERPCVWG